MALKITIRERVDGAHIVALEGRLDTETYISFEDRMKPFLTPPGKTVIIDMQGLEYISSAGLGVIFTAKKAIESNGGKILMTNLKPPIKRVFDIVKALPAQSVFESMEEVDKYLYAMQKKHSNG